MRQRRVLLTGALLGVLAAGGLTGCNDDEGPGTRVAVAALPTNLCAAVPAEVVDRWGLAEAGHDVERGSDRSTATCSMTGRVAGAPVTLDLSLTSFGGADADAARTRMADDLADRCADLESSAVGRYAHAENRCSTETGKGPQQGRVTEISRSLPAYGVVSVAMTHGGPMWQLVGPEVVGLSGTLATTDPGDLA